MRTEILLAVIADRSEKDLDEITRVYNDKGLLAVVKTALDPIANTDSFMGFMAEFGEAVAEKSAKAYLHLARLALQRVINEHFQMSQNVWDFFGCNAEQLSKTKLRDQVTKVVYLFLESINEDGNTPQWGNSFTTPLEVRQFCQRLVDNDDRLREETVKHIDINNWPAYSWLLRASVKQKRLTWRELVQQLHCGINLPQQLALRRAIA